MTVQSSLISKNTCNQKPSGNPKATLTWKPEIPISVRTMIMLVRLTRLSSLLSRCGIPKKPISQTPYIGVFKLILDHWHFVYSEILKHMDLVQFGTNPNLNRNMRNRNPVHCLHLSIKSWLERVTKRTDGHDKQGENIHSLPPSFHFHSDSLWAKHLLSHYSDCRSHCVWPLQASVVQQGTNVFLRENLHLWRAFSYC